MIGYNAIMLTVLGIDPGYANLGFAAVNLMHPSGSSITEIQLVTTKPSPKKLRLAVADDDSRRLIEIEDHLLAFLDKHKPQIISIEDPPWGKSAKAVKCCALMWGAAHGIARNRGLPVVNISAKTIKKVVTGTETASKEDMLDALKAKHPTFKGWLDKKAVEHVADAVGAAIAARTHPVVYALLSAVSLART